MKQPVIRQGGKLDQLFHHCAGLLWFWARTSHSLKDLGLTWHQLVGVTRSVPLSVKRPQVALAVVGRWTLDRSKIDKESLRGMLFPPGSVRDGAWRNGYDFAIVTGDVGEKVDTANSSPILDVLFKMGLSVSFFNFAKFVRQPGPRSPPNRLMYLCCCYSDSSLAFDSVASRGCAVVGITKEVDFRREAVRQHIIRHMALLPTLLMVMIDCAGGYAFSADQF